MRIFKSYLSQRDWVFLLVLSIKPCSSSWPTEGSFLVKQLLQLFGLRQQPMKANWICNKQTPCKTAIVFQKRWLYGLRSPTIFGGNGSSAPVVGFVSPFIAIICIRISGTDVTVQLVTTKGLLAEFSWAQPRPVNSPTWLIHCVLWQQVGFSSGCKWLLLSCASYGGAHLCACFSWDQGGAWE